MSATPLLVAAAGGMFAGLLAGRVAERLWLATTLLGLIAAFTAAVTVLAGGHSWEWRSALLLGGEPLHFLIAVEACAIAGGPFVGHPEVNNGAASVVPVDLYIPGCPPHPLTILDGLLRLLDRLEGK